MPISEIKSITLKVINAIQVITTPPDCPKGKKVRSGYAQLTPSAIEPVRFLYDSDFLRPLFFCKQYYFSHWHHRERAFKSFNALWRIAQGDTVRPPLSKGFVLARLLMNRSGE